MKTKIFLGVLFLLLACVLIGNTIFGNKMSKELDRELKAKMAENELPVSIEYAELKVNPLFSQVSVTDFLVTDHKDIRTFSCPEIEIDIPYDEALRLVEEGRFEELYAVKLNFNHPKIESTKAKLVLEMNDLVIDFNGHLTMADIENLDATFPKKKQRLNVSLSKLMVKVPELFGKAPFAGLIEQLTEIDKASYSIEFIPEEKKIDLRNFDIRSSILKYTGNSSVNYVGDGLKNFKATTTESMAEMIVEPEDFSWSQGDGNGEFSMDKLFVKSRTSFDLEKMTLPEGEIKIELEKLKLNSDEQKKKPFNMSLNNLEVEKLDLNYALRDNKLSITDTEIMSSELEATIFANVDMDESMPANSTIKEATVKVKSLSPYLQQMVKMLEMQMGKELPREDSTIVLELSGKLMRPTIRGFEF